MDNRIAFYAKIQAFPVELPQQRPVADFRDDLRLFPMASNLRRAYEVFERETTEQVVRMLDEGDPSGLLPWFYSLLRFPDMPWLPWECKTRRGLVLGEVPALQQESEPTAIEEGLVAYVREQFVQQIPVLVFTENSGCHDDQGHLKMLLERSVRNETGMGPRVAVLRGTVQPCDRIAWLWNRLEEGLDVLLCNPTLVFGMDLRAFPRIIFKRMPVTVARLRQSARCSFRPGQTRDVEAIVCAYEHSLALRWYVSTANGTGEPTLEALGDIARESLEYHQQAPIPR